MNYVNPLRSKSSQTELSRPLGRRPTVGAGWEIEPLEDRQNFLRSYGGRIAVSWATAAGLSVIVWLPAAAEIMREGGIPPGFADDLVAVMFFYFIPCFLSVLLFLAPIHFWIRHRAMRRITDASDISDHHLAEVGSTRQGFRTPRESIHE